MSVSDLFADRADSPPQARSPAGVRFNNTFRDGVQSLMGTNPSPEEIVASHPNAGKIGNGWTQTGGGTFYDVFLRKGRDPAESIKTINGAYPDVEKAALIRNECGVGYKRSPLDVIREMILQHARAGIRKFQNFHGLNDTQRTGPVDRIIKEIAEEEGLDIHSAASICIEDGNPNITLESCLAAARDRIEAGCKGFYLKSASGLVDPDFARDLTGALLDEFPDQPVDIHIHDTYGEAIPAYMAAIEAGAARGKGVGVDVLHPAIAGNTAQPDILKVQAAILAHPDEKVRAMAPAVDMEVIEADMDSLLDLRMRYRDSETKYNPRLLEAMRAAKAPGGASATLRAIPGLESNLASVLGTTDWDEIQIAVYEMQAEILPRLGSPTQVTPYALRTTVEAAFAVLRKAQGKDPLSGLAPDTVDYLVGRLGRVPETADPDLVKMALEKAGLDKPVDLSAEVQPAGMDAARRRLEEKGITDPSDEDILIAASVSDKSKPDMGLDFLVDKLNGRITPQKPAVLPLANLLDTRALDPVPSASVFKKQWLNTENPRINGTPPLGRELLETIGGPIAFERLAQAVLTIERHNNPPLFPDRNVPQYLRDVDRAWEQKARDEVAGFWNRVGEYAAENGLGNGEARTLNKIVSDFCAGKGIREIDPDILPPFHQHSFDNSYIPPSTAARRAGNLELVLVNG